MRSESLDGMYANHFEPFRSDAGQVDMTMLMNDFDLRLLEVGQMLEVLRGIAMDEAHAFDAEHAASAIKATIALLATVREPFGQMFAYVRAAERRGEQGDDGSLRSTLDAVEARPGSLTAKMAQRGQSPLQATMERSRERTTWMDRKGPSWMDRQGQ